MLSETRGSTFCTRRSSNGRMEHLTVISLVDRLSSFPFAPLSCLAEVNPPCVTNKPERQVPDPHSDDLRTQVYYHVGREPNSITLTSITIYTSSPPHPLSPSFHCLNRLLIAPHAQMSVLQITPFIVLEASTNGIEFQRMKVTSKWLKEDVK